MSTISIIVAIAENGVIGGDNKLLWHISDDLKRFKLITSGYPIIMGRKTHESLGRPLPNRRNIVITRQNDYKADGCEVVHSLDEALVACQNEQEVFVIGGGEIYRQALPMTDKLYLTIVHKAYEGDTTFPPFDLRQWNEVFNDKHMGTNNFDTPFSFLIYERKK